MIKLSIRVADRAGVSMCKDMCLDMRMDMCTGMCTDLCIYMNVDIFMDMQCR